MNVKNCKRCKRLFNYIAGPPICPECKAKEEELFQTVKKYIDAHKGVNITTVAQECEVEIDQIQRWVREERLQFSDASAAGIVCEKCGANILTGRFCEKCKKEMANNLNELLPKKGPAPKKPTKESPKMRFLQ